MESIVLMNIFSMEYLEYLIILSGVFAFFYFMIKILKEEKVKEEQLNNKLDQDEFIYDPETKGRMTLKQAEEGYSLIDPQQNKSGLPYIRVQETSHEDTVNSIYSGLPENKKEILSKRVISTMIEIIEEVTYPEMTLTDELLDKTYLLTKERGIEISKDDIKLIWDT